MHLISEQLPPHLHGITHYGDNIQDEWFIVALLFEISRQITGLIIRVIDSDGEFLLIESADYLPQWATPETCEQRVYIYNGTLNLVQNTSSNTQQTIKISEAIQKIRQSPTLYRVSEKIEKCVMERISDYPEKIYESLHRTTVYVPLGVATLLKHNPSLISAACRAFCNRDVLDLKACRAMRYFPPENRVYTSVVFTKCLYAMLLHSNYVPDKRTGWHLPPNNDQLYKSHNLGIKIACGFEILASQAKPFKNIEEDKGWSQYLAGLKKRNYFQDNIEGSKDYTRLLDVAKEFYTENRESMNYASTIGREIITNLQNLESNASDFSDSLPEKCDDDDDNWLNISPEELDELLTSRYGVKKLFSVNGNVDMNNFSSQISDFFDQKSEFDGIENIDIPPVRPKRGIKKKSPTKVNGNSSTSSTGASSSSTYCETDENQINFDPEGFQNQVQNLLDLIIPEDNWESNSEMSDYDDDDEELNNGLSNMAASSDEIKTSLKRYMDQMDLELSKTTIGKSFEKKTTGDTDFDDIEDFTPVDIDMNTVKNMVESYQSQLGGPGPASTLLTSMGLGISNNENVDDLDKLNTQV